MSEIRGLKGIAVGILTEIKADLISDDGGRLDKFRVRCNYTDKYLAPTIYAKNNRVPCHPHDLLGKKVIIKWSESENSNGFESLFLFVMHFSNIENAKDSLRLLMLKEKKVGVGAKIEYMPKKAVIDKKFFSHGGTHWERFLLTRSEDAVKGERITVTRNNSNTYAISA